MFEQGSCSIFQGSWFKGMGSMGCVRAVRRTEEGSLEPQSQRGAERFFLLRLRHMLMPLKVFEEQ